MDFPTTDKDRKVAAGGAVAALAVGLMLGGAMHPNLAGDGRPEGPQQILGKAAQRSTGPFDPGPEMASWTGKVPDYVLGTDLTRPAPQPSAAVSPPNRELVRYDESYDPPRDIARPVLIVPPGDEALRRVRYPSLGDRLPTHAPVGQAVDDAYVDPGR